MTQPTTFAQCVHQTAQAALVAAEKARHRHPAQQLSALFAAFDAMPPAWGEYPASVRVQFAADFDERLVLVWRLSVAIEVARALADCVVPARLGTLSDRYVAAAAADAIRAIAATRLSVVLPPVVSSAVTSMDRLMDVALQEARDEQRQGVYGYAKHLHTQACARRAADVDA